MTSKFDQSKEPVEPDEKSKFILPSSVLKFLLHDIFVRSRSGRHGSLGAMERRHNLQREEVQPELEILEIHAADQRNGKKNAMIFKDILRSQICLCFVSKVFEHAGSISLSFPRAGLGLFLAFGRFEESHQDGHWHLART